MSAMLVLCHTIHEFVYTTLGVFVTWIFDCPDSDFNRFRHRF